jgi:SAM-dependent methyltransferase
MERAPVGAIFLDIAPARHLSELIKQNASASYIAIDFDPSADGRQVDAQASVTKLPVRTGEVGVTLCSHVLEHVADDRSAASEISRTLHPEGVALIQVPRRLGVPTDEDPNASFAEREVRFGQADHVRYYGEDFECRLEAAGLKVLNTSYSRILPLPLLRLIGAANDEELWIATTGADPRPFIDTQSAVVSLARTLMGSAATDRELSDARHEAAEWRSRYEWLHNRPVIRVAAYTKRRLKNLIARSKAY